MFVWALHDSIKLLAKFTHLVVGPFNRLPLTEQCFNCHIVLELVSSNLLLDLLDCLSKEGGQVMTLSNLGGHLLYIFDS